VDGRPAGSAPARDAVRRRAALLALLLVVAGCAELRARYPGPDVVFIATPEAVGGEMLKLASVSVRDVVYDLGSGDGRVVIAAARDFGARGVGVEIDPQLVQASRDRAQGAGVAERATFLWQDLFVTELAGATVVTVYLRDDVNLRLRPKLLRELAPGSRVVSHDFDMGDWRPDRVQRVRGPHRDHTLYLWLVPADVAGVWRTRVGPREGVLNLSQRYQTLGGSFSLDGRELALTEATLRGDRITLTAAGGLVLSGRVSADAMEGEAGERGATPQAWSSQRLR
jgi:SAM-dependent methyltransferase